MESAFASSTPVHPTSAASPAQKAALGNERRLATMMITRVWLALAGFVVAATLGRWVISAIMGYVVYSSVLTAVHHLIHSSLGLSPRGGGGRRALAHLVHCRCRLWEGKNGGSSVAARP